MNLKNDFYTTKFDNIWNRAYGNINRDFLVRQWFISIFLFIASIFIFHSFIIVLLIPSIFIYPYSSYGWHYLKYILFGEQSKENSSKGRPIMHLKSDAAMGYMLGELMSVVIKLVIMFGVAMLNFVLAIPLSIFWAFVLLYSNKNY